MPTANLQVEEGVLPEDGVYATRMLVGDEKFISVTNIGARPTIDQEAYITVETYIIDFDRDIYGESVALEVCKYLRPVRQFANLQEVQKQVQTDVRTAQDYFNAL